MFDPKQAGNTLAPYQPRPAEAQRMDTLHSALAKGSR